MQYEYKNSNTEIEELKFSDLFRVIKKYRYSIVIIAFLVSFVSVAIDYYKSGQYVAQATIEIATTNKSTNVQDVLQAALMGSSTSDIDTQKAILKSRMIVLDAMDKVDVITHIWSVDKLLKSKELYINKPFIVKLIKGYGIKFKIIPNDDYSYTIEYNAINNKGVKFLFRKRYRYNQVAKSKDFELKIDKTNNPIDAKYYNLIVYEPYKYAEMIRSSKINVTQLEGKANILAISYSDSIALRAKEFVNELVKSYMKRNVEYKTKQANETLNFINRQLEIIQLNLTKSEKNIENFKRKQKTINIKQSAEQISKELADYENKFAILDMQIAILQSVYNKIKKGTNLETLTLMGIDIDTSSVTRLINELQQTILQRRVLLKTYTSAHPEVRKLSSKIVNLKVIIKKSVYNMLKGLYLKKRQLAKRIKVYRLKLEKLPKAQQDYLTLERKFTFNSKFYNYLLEKKTETQIKKSAAINLNRIIDLAITPDRANQKSIILSALLGFIEGIVLGVIIAFIRNFFDKTINYKEEVQKETKIPIIAQIPHSKIKQDYSLISKVDKDPLILENFRILRTNLQFIVEDNDYRVVTITSTTKREGKSIITSNLAYMLQLLDKRVIVLDLNFTNPSIHKYYELDNKIGLSEYLKGNARLDKVVKHTKFGNLDIIPSGVASLNPSELISSDRLKELINRLRKHYDYIFLDTSSIDLITDTRVLLKLSDVTLYIVRLNYSKKDYINTINTLYEKGYSKSFNLLLNDTKEKGNTLLWL